MSRAAILRGAALAMLLAAGAAGGGGAADKAAYLELADRGWDYTFRGTAQGRAGTLPPSHVMARDMPGRAICLIGEAPHPDLRAMLETFRAMMADIFGTVGALRDGGADIADCAPDATVFVRFYSLDKPDPAFNDDLAALSRRFDLGLSDKRLYGILSPAQAVTLFGRNEQITHIALMQPRHAVLTPLEIRFFRSLVIEEFYQSYSFGIDIFRMGRGTPLLSKLQETPVNLRFLSWTSVEYMQGLLASNPEGLCHFDAMMLHALAEVEDDAPGALRDLLDRRFAALDAAARETAANPDYAALFDPACR